MSRPMHNLHTLQRDGIEKRLKQDDKRIELIFSGPIRLYKSLIVNKAITLQQQHHG
jgi:hypothetical protein